MVLGVDGLSPHLAFDHQLATEASYDGGNVKISVNGGPWTVIPPSAYSFNPQTAALATTLALSAVFSCIGIGFQRGTHARWQLVTNDSSGAPTLVDMGASFAIATGGVLTLTIAASPNAGSIWVRVVDEVSGAVFEQEVTADLPASNQFLSPRLFMNNGATAAAVAFDCAGVYVETDY